MAAPSMKAALEAWGAGSNLFHQGVAKETDDPDVVAAAMLNPGAFLKRPAGSNGRFPVARSIGLNGTPCAALTAAVHPKTRRPRLT
jgi:hypothetical protein